MHHAKYKGRAPKVYTVAVFLIEYAQLQISQAKGWRKIKQVMVHTML